MSSSVDLMVTRQEFRSEATDVKKGPIAASAFVIPAGYTKEASPLEQK